MTLPVRIDSTLSDEHVLSRLADEALACQGKVEASLQLARSLSSVFPQPGGGSTAALWDVLATVAAADITVARVIEPHLDALAILNQASRARKVARLNSLGVSTDSTWGVFAAEAPGAQLTATALGDRWELNGRKAWCSLAGSLSHALVTAYTGDTARRLFAVALRQPGITVSEGTWHSTGLTAVQSGSVDFSHVEAIPVGEDEWYRRRPGFAWGSIGVAACWWGGAIGIARRALTSAQDREPDQIALMHLGAIDTALHTARVALAAAATLVDNPETDRESTAIVAHRTRNAVSGVAEDVMTRVGHALGPGPLSLEPDHARRVADLQIYLRQHHAERDDVALGRKLLNQSSPQW